MTKKRTFTPCAPPQVLLKSGWLSERPVGFQNRMMSFARWRRFLPGESLYQTDDGPNGVFGIETGAVDLSMSIASGEMVNVWRAQPGFWAGTSVFARQQSASCAVARVETLVLILPADALHGHVAAHPEDLIHVLELSHRNMVTFFEALGEIIALPPRAQFARMLLRLAPVDDLVRVTQRELGAMAGMSRAAFRRSFCELLERGIVRTEYGAIRILDRLELQNEALRS